MGQIQIGVDKQLPFNAPDWLFELKNDGYRMLAEFGAGAVTMRTRGGHDCTSWFPKVAEALARFKGAGPTWWTARSA